MLGPHENLAGQFFGRRRVNLMNGLDFRDGKTVIGGNDFDEDSDLEVTPVLTPDYNKITYSKQIATPHDLHDEAGPLGLKLTITSSFAELVEEKLSQAKKSTPTKIVQGTIKRKENLSTELISKRAKYKNNDFAAQPISEKLKASNVAVLMLIIGSWVILGLPNSQRLTRYVGDLVAKCYYARRKLVWEVLDAGLKSKIEIDWSNISAIRASFPENEPGILEIELQSEPKFGQESNPQPRKHTMWNSAADFTGGQAHLYRRHCLHFQEGTFEKHYEKLLQSDERLYQLSQKPFPSLSSPFFHRNHVGYQDNANVLNTSKIEFPPGFYPPFNHSHPSQLPQFSIAGSARPIGLAIVSTLSPLTFSGPQFKHDRSFCSEGLNHQEQISGRNADQTQEMPSIASSTQINPCLPSADVLGTFTSNNQLLGETLRNTTNGPLISMCPTTVKTPMEVNRLYSVLNPSMNSDSTVEKIDSSQQYIQEDIIGDCSLLSRSSEMCPNSAVWPHFRNSNENPFGTMPQIAPSPDFSSDQALDYLADGKPNKAWKRKHLGHVWIPINK